MTQSSNTVHRKAIDLLLATLLSTALVAGAILSVALYAGFEGFHRGELAVEQTKRDDLPPQFGTSVRDDYEMVKSSYSWVALAFLTALALHLITQTTIINWIVNLFIVGLMIGAGYQFKSILWFKTAALDPSAAYDAESKVIRFAFMRDTYPLDIVVCVVIVVAILFLLVKLHKTRNDGRILTQTEAARLSTDEEH